MRDHPRLVYPDVPCDGCRLCCINDLIRLLPGDDHEQYQTEPHPYAPGHLMLAHKPNRECVYLGPDGCTIQDSKPMMCREMDCRGIAKAFTYTQARKQKGTDMRVWRRGRELLKVIK